MTLGIRKTKAPTPTRSMGLVCFITARAEHLYPSGVGFIMGGIVFSSLMKVKELRWEGEVPKIGIMKRTKRKKTEKTENRITKTPQ
jgi:hypothetical protein